MSATREATRASSRQALDVWNEVPLVPQTTGMSCWAAAASMLIGWRDAVPVDPEEVARAAGHWESYRDGMRPGSVPDLARIWGLQAEAAPRWTPGWLARRLAEVGPLWIGEASPGLHAVVLVGLRGDGTEDGTEVLVNDPWPVGRGERYRLPFAELVQRVRAAASTAGPHVRVLHTDGRGRGARRHVHVQESTMSETLSYGADALQQSVAAGSATLDAHARGQPLHDHGGAGPSLYLRWNGFTAPDDPAVDVVLYFHGYSDHGPDVVLSHKVRSEIRAHAEPALGGRAAPTLLIVPRGLGAETTAAQRASGLPRWAYSFPAVASEAGVRRLVTYALEQLARAAHLPRTPRVARRIYAGHSGGGAPVGAILTNHARWHDADPDEVWLFDATYGDGAGVRAWLGTPARRPADRRLRVFHQRRANGSLTRTGSGAEAIARHVAAQVPAEPRGR
ncbi:MAG: papain-like cysteine protease family protein, partial [Myxococcota bacterium]